MTTYKTSITDTTPFANYIFGVSATNQMGTGVQAQSAPAQFNFNKATGGVEAEVTNFNGSGETWKTHTFTSNGTFTVQQNPRDFRVLIVAGGGVGGTGCPNGSGGGGGGGGVYEDLAWTLNNGDYPVVVGAGGPVDNGDYHPCGRNYGGDSSFNGVMCGGGGTGGTGAWNGKKPLGGGCGGRPGSGGGQNGQAGGAGSLDHNPPASGSPAPQGPTSDITGTSTVYGQGGNYAWPQGYGGGGKPMSPQGGPTSVAGTAGIVIVAYRVG